MAARDHSLFKEASPPREEEYLVVLEFKSTVMSQFNANRGKWLARERAFLLADRQAVSTPRRYAPLAPASAGRHNGRANPPKTKGPRNPVLGAVRVDKSSSPKPEKTKDKTKSTRDDKEFDKLPDYSPPISSLPPNPNMKVEWKGGSLDISQMPYLDLLHPSEVYLASRLRLIPATYLTAKRRIFMRRLEFYRNGLDFKRTHAQNACNIDVNKASKLWEAYDKVGWFAERWVEPFA